MHFSSSAGKGESGIRKEDGEKQRTEQRFLREGTWHYLSKRFHVKLELFSIIHGLVIWHILTHVDDKEIRQSPNYP